MAIPNVNKLGVHAVNEYGDAIIERMSGKGAPKMTAALRAHYNIFLKAQKAHETALNASTTAREEWYLAARVVFDADAERDAAIEKLATTIADAGLNTRLRPFRDFSTHSPAQIKKLAYKVETIEVRKLANKIRAAKPSAKVRAAAELAVSLGEPVDAALKKLGAPRREAARTQAKREAAELVWRDAFDHFKRKADGDWQDEPGAFDGVFQSVDAAQSPKKRRAVGKKKTANGAAATAPEAAKIAAAVDAKIAGASAAKPSTG